MTQKLSPPQSNSAPSPGLQHNMMPNPSLCTASHGVHIAHLHMMLGVLIYVMYLEQLNVSVSHVKNAAGCKGEARFAVHGTCLFPEEVCKIQDPLVYRILLLRLLLWLLLHNRHRHTFHCLSRSKDSGPFVLQLPRQDATLLQCAKH